jgi:hypothetical protein
MNNNNSKYILPVCAMVASFFGISIIQYSVGLFFEALPKGNVALPNITRIALQIHNYRWLILFLGTAGLMVACWKARTESKANLVSGLYMLAWFGLCFAVQFSLVLVLNVVRRQIP